MENIIYEYTKVNDSKLKEYIINTPTLHKYFKLEWKTLKTRQYCGILNYEDKDYYLLPKISKDNPEQNLNIFIYMLRYAYNIKLENEDIASSENLKSNNILEVFIQMFALNLLNELKKGIYKEYTTQEDNLTTLKGKYLINENLKYNFTKNKIYCQYDEFSSNNCLNQFFLYAVKYLQKFTQNKKLLKQCELIFDEVEYKQFNIDNLNLHFNRLNQRFKTSFEVAILLLKQSIPLFSKDKKSFAFLFDMNVLFEKFIAKIVQSIDESAKIQNSDNFADLTLKPDILLQHLIIDTKYKKISSISDIKQSDKYQVFAYGIVYDIKNVMLLYPKHLDELNKNLVLGNEDKNVNLKIKCIELNSNKSYKEYIETIKYKVRELV